MEGQNSVANNSFAGTTNIVQGNVISGPTTFNFGHRAPGEETPPRPSILIPFSRDRDFVERADVFDQLDEKRKIPGTRLALVGLGGVGKSQLAIEYAYRAREQAPMAWVFWVYAGNAIRFEQGLHDVVSFLKIPGRHQAGANILQLLHDWLADEQNGSWLLVVDNVDNSAFLVLSGAGTEHQPEPSRQGSKPLISYVPHCLHGSVLVTSRNKMCALDLVEERDIVPIKPMGEHEAVKLLQNKLAGENDTERIKQLATALDHMPLALAQAAAYISQRAPLFSVRRYLQEFHENDKSKASLLSQDGGKLRRDPEAKNSILVTWQITFDHLREERPSAANLLSVMSFCDRQGIPRSLLRHANLGKEKGASNENSQLDRDAGRPSSRLKSLLKWRSQGRHSSPVSARPLDRTEAVTDGGEGLTLEDDLMVLLNFSLVSLSDDRTTLEMHRLVQLATDQWLQTHGQRGRWERQFLSSLLAEFPRSGRYEYWPTYRMLYPHIKAAASTRISTEHETLDLLAIILQRAADYAFESGNLVDAEEMLMKSMNAYIETGQRNNGSCLAVMGHLLDIYIENGQWHKAEELGSGLVDQTIQSVGSDHWLALTHMISVSKIHRHQQRWDLAETLLVQAEESFVKTQGANGPGTLACMVDRAVLLGERGSYEKAETLLLRAIEGETNSHSGRHPRVLLAKHYLAGIYVQWERLDAAEKLYVEVFKSERRVLGSDNPNTLATMRNLAETWWALGRHQDGIRLMTECHASVDRQGLGQRQEFTTVADTLRAWQKEDGAGS